MSIWADINRRSQGLQKRKEDADTVYFKLNCIDKFEVCESVVFNKGTSHECECEFLTYGRLDEHPIFKLVKGNKEDVNNDVIYDDKNGFRHYTSTTFIGYI